MLEKILKSLGIDSLNFVSSIEIIEAGNVVKEIDLTENNELKFKQIKTSEKKRRGRPKLKAFARFKRAAGKTKRFAVGEEPNKRAFNRI